MTVGILFDLDGTLLNSLEDLTDAVNYTMSFFGCPPRCVEDVRSFVGTGAANLLRKALPGQADDPAVEAALAVYMPYYAAHALDKTRPYPGIAPALEEIGKKYPVAIVSNKPDEATKALCADYFPGIFARGEGADCPRKPAPDMIHQTMARLGVDTCIYVGDSETDVETAHNAGVPCLSVLWGFRDRSCLTQAGSKWFCEDPQDLPQMLEHIINEELYGK